MVAVACKPVESLASKSRHVQDVHGRRAARKGLEMRQVRKTFFSRNRSPHPTGGGGRAKKERLRKKKTLKPSLSALRKSANFRLDT